MKTFRVTVDVDGEVFATMRYTFVVKAKTKKAAEKLALAASTETYPSSDNCQLLYDSIEEESFEGCGESPEDGEFSYRRIADKDAAYLQLSQSSFSTGE
jgi:hypothetical protein